MEILDAHHHIWRREDLPWLAGPMQDAVFWNTVARVYRLRTGVGKEGKTKWH